MTDRFELTYTGPIRAGTVSVPGRRVAFTRGVPVSFTATEAATLPDEWDGVRPVVEGGPLDGTRQGVDVPADRTGFLLEDDHGSIAAVAGRRFGTVDEVLAAAITPERARLLLDHEQTLAKPRRTLVDRLTELAAVANPAGPAGPAEEA